MIDWTQPTGMDRSRALTIACQEAKAEALRAMDKWEVFHSVHEGYGVILEELDELWFEIKAKSPDPLAMREEVIHLAAMALRFAAELTPPLS
jgi:hypothetical protein